MLTQRKLSNVLGSAIEGIDLSRELADAEFCVLARALWEGEACWRSRGSASRPASSWRLRAASVGPSRTSSISSIIPATLTSSSSQIDATTESRSDLPDAGSYFHTDYSYLKVPARLTMLYSIEVPSYAGSPTWRGLRRPRRKHEAAHRPPRGAAPLRQSRRSQQGLAHRRLDADGRAEGQGELGAPRAGSHASFYRTQGALRGFGQLVRDRRHARGRRAPPAGRVEGTCAAGQISLELLLRGRRRRALGRLVDTAFRNARGCRRSRTLADHGSRRPSSGIRTSWTLSIDG